MKGTGPSPGRARLLALAFILVFCVAGALTLPKYGLTWDEGLGNLFFGERYAHYFATFDRSYLDFYDPNLAIHGRPLNLYASPFRFRPNEYPPLVDTLSAATMELLAYRLGWLDPVDAFHLPKILLCAVLLWAVFEFARSRLGTPTAFLSILLLGAYPRFWGDMHFNPKDIPETVFFALTVLAFAAWARAPTWKRALGTGALWGCALAVKANALFVPAVLLLGALPWQRKAWPWPEVGRHLRRRWPHYGLMLGCGLVIHLLTWPVLFVSPRKLLRYYSFIFAQGGRHGPGVWNWDALLQTVSTMPEIVGVLLLIGIGLAIKRRHAPEAPVLRLLLAWLTIPILRTSLPAAVNYDGIRHFEEFLPAACLLAAYGAASIVERLRAAWPRWQTAWTTGLLLVVGGNLAWALARYAPYEYLYYNSLVGGLAGANRRHAMPEATDYWASSYREGLRWLDGHAPRNALLHVPVAPWVVDLTAPLWLRKDIGVIPASKVTPALAAGQSVYVMFITRVGFYTPVAKLCEARLAPVHEVVVDGVPILKIYLLRRDAGPV
jgi:hypothetical protein